MIRITPGAKEEFISYINSHIKAKKHEIKCSKISNITENIDEYFQIELKEKDHKDIVQMIKKNKNVFSKPIMKKWIIENYNENYIEKNKSCD